MTRTPTGPAEEVDVADVGAADWPEIEQLFGQAGASNGCWCQYWLLGAGYHRRDRQLNRADLAHQIEQGGSGLLARRGDEPVGWARLTRRSTLTQLLARFPRYDFGGDDPYALSCFFVPRAQRGRGVMRALIEHAADLAEGAGETMEAYPIDPDAPGATRNRFPGVVGAFLPYGFVEVGRLARDRVVVRRVPGP